MAEDSKLDQIRDEYNKLLRTTLLALQPEGYKSDYHWEKGGFSQHASVTPKEGGQVELGFSWGQAQTDAASYGPKVTAAIADILVNQCGVDSIRVKQSGGSFLDYQMTFYSTSFKAAMPDNEDTLEKLKAATAYVETGDLNRILARRELKTAISGAIEAHKKKHPHRPVTDEDLGLVMQQITAEQRAKGG